MSNVWCLALWLVVSTTLSAPATAAPSDLTSALKRYKNLQSLEVPFEQIKTLKDMDFEIRSRGELKIEPENLIWELRSPVPMKVELREGGLRIGGQEQKIPDKYKQELQRLLGWLRFDPSAWERDYQVQSEKPGEWLFRPKSTDTPFQLIRLRLSANGFAEQAELTEISQDRLILNFGAPKVRYKK